MARIAIQPYTPTTGAGNGEAVLFSSGLTPLTLLRQEKSINERLAARQAAERQKQQAQDTKNLQKVRLGLAESGFLPFEPELEQNRQQTIAGMNAIAQNQALNSADKNRQYDQVYGDWKSKVGWTREVEKRFKDVVQLSARDKRYNPVAVDAALQNSLNDAEGNRLSMASFHPEALNTVLERPEVLNRTEVAKQFLEGLSAKADMSTASTAARPGGYGQRNTAESNYFELENGTYKLDPSTGQRIPRTDRTEVIEAARRDPFVSKLIGQQIEAHQQQVAGVVEKMRNNEQLTPEEQQVVQQEQTEPKRYASYLNELLLPHAYGRTSELQTYSRPIAPKAAPKPKATPKQSASEVTVTPTVGYQASTYQPQATTISERLKQKALGITPPITTNYYPVVGQTFASATRPYVEVETDNRGAEVVGEGGKTTALALGNGKAQMQLVSRDYTLYINGKRVGRKEAFQSDQDAYSYMLAIIEGLTPEQVGKAELRTEYRGTLTDKARTANDGAGGAAIAAKGEEDGKPLWNGKTFATPKGNSGAAETRLNVIVPANQVTDAQLQRASGGKWNPRQPTPQQQRAIDALTRKGGRVVTPHSTTTTPSAQLRTDTKTVGSNDVLGFGAPKKEIKLRIGTPIGEPDIPTSNRGGKFYKAAGTKPSGFNLGTPTNDPRRAGAY